MDSTVLEQIVKSLNNKYKKETPLVVHCGPTQEYLGMLIVYSQPGSAPLSMPEYIDGVVSEMPLSLLKGT